MMVSNFNIIMFMIIIHCTLTPADVTLSVPTTLTVAEEDGTARVCVTVSTAIDIDISVTASDGKVIVRLTLSLFFGGP